MYNNKFKRFGGDWIQDITGYLKEKIEDNPNITISVGCDSIQKRRRTIYACTLMINDKDARDGAHVVFFRESHEKIRDTEQRLYKEAILAYEIAEFLNKELEPFYVRKDIDTFERKKYKYHIKKCNGEIDFTRQIRAPKSKKDKIRNRYYIKIRFFRLNFFKKEYNINKTEIWIPRNNITHDINKYIENITLNDHEKNVDYKLVDIHVDFNPFEKTKQLKGKTKKESYTDNKSVSAYRSYVPWLRGLQYRVYSKPLAWAASSAADLLLQD